MKKKNKKIIIWTIFFILLIPSLINAYILILEPSYVSFLSACNPQKAELDFPTYVTKGQATYSPKDENITIELFSKDPIVLKHECIHVNQFERGYPSTSCGKPLSKLFTEIEAYSFSRLPNNFYMKIYGTKCLDGVLKDNQ